MDRKLAQDLIQQWCFVSRYWTLGACREAYKATTIPIILAAKLLSITGQKHRDKSWRIGAGFITPRSGSASHSVYDFIFKYRYLFADLSLRDVIRWISGLGGSNTLIVSPSSGTRSGRQLCKNVYHDMTRMGGENERTILKMGCWDSTRLDWLNIVCISWIFR
jgi:hypothetical protein